MGKSVLLTRRAFKGLPQSCIVHLAMRVAFVGDMLNHGYYLTTVNTGILLALSECPQVDEIDAYCPRKNPEAEPFNPPSKLNIHESYNYGDPHLPLKLIRKLAGKNYDTIIFSLLPTSFGTSSTANFAGLLTPLLLRHLAGQNTRIVYHNSAYTNNYRKLGYNSAYDTIRANALRAIERTIFKTTPTYVLLRQYKEKITSQIGPNRVEYLNARGLEALPTIYLNNLQNQEEITIRREGPPTILLHGYWGPQKDLKLALQTLTNLKNKGYKFNTVITGGINKHFPEYTKQFQQLLKQYGYEKSYKGRIQERDIFTLYTQADLLLLPYNTPGGHSGVLEQAIFFETPTIAIDFPEYREQAEDFDHIKLCNRDQLFVNISNALERMENARTVRIKSKLSYTMKAAEQLLSKEL